MARTRWFRVAVEGLTASDGRKIERNWLTEAADTYDLKTYGARVNVEHIRGFSGEKPFRAMGDVVALKAEEVELSIGGKTEKRLALYAQIDPTDDLIKLTKERQKIYTSIEVAPNFAGTGKAGLVGLAVTDTPASLGTEMLTFSAGANAGVLKDRVNAFKSDPANVLSAAEETSFELEPEATGGGDSVDSFFDALTRRLGFNREADPKAPAAPAKTETPAAPAAGSETPQQHAATGGAEMVLLMAALQKDFTTAMAELRKDFSAQLKAVTDKLDSTPQSMSARPQHTGGADIQLTDC